MLGDECLKHSYYTRVSFLFSGLFYSNFIVFVARLLIWCFVWLQVHWSKKGSFWKHFWKQWGAKQESGCHVATFQRHDIPTSRHPHVATSPRRDVGSTMQKSTIRNVMTLQRRDVGTGSAHHHLKHEWFGIRGIGRHTNEGTEFQSRVTQTSKKCPGFVLFLIFVGY